MDAEKKTAAGLEVADPHNTGRSDNEKSAALYNDNSDVSSGSINYDDLPDPDIGKTDEERARLVRSFPSRLFHCLPLTDST